MSVYESLIDPAEFGLIADYLRSSRTPINYLVHVRSLESLAPLAEALERQRHDDQPPWLFPKVVESGLADGSLRISARDLAIDPKCIVDPRTVPRQALCHVIYAPPIYIVHTAGLFEGTLIRPETGVSLDRESDQKMSARRKL